MYSLYIYVQHPQCIGLIGKMGKNDYFGVF